VALRSARIPPGPARDTPTQTSPGTSTRECVGTQDRRPAGRRIGDREPPRLTSSLGQRPESCVSSTRDHEFHDDRGDGERHSSRFLDARRRRWRGVAPSACHGRRDPVGARHTPSRVVGVHEPEGIPSGQCRRGSAPPSKTRLHQAKRTTRRAPCRSCSVRMDRSRTLNARRASRASSRRTRRRVSI
jgi:hypothetical protein